MNYGLIFVIFSIHAALYLASYGYAQVLQRIHDLYAPDHIWVTVAIGVGMILLAFLAFVPFGLVTLDAWALAASLTLAAGAPVIRWQRRQAEKRAAEREAAKRRKERQ